MGRTRTPNGSGPAAERYADKAMLRERAEAEGITVQALLERAILGQEQAARRAPGRRPRTQREQLPMTG